MSKLSGRLERLMRFGGNEVSFGTSGVRISQRQKKTRNGVPVIFGLTLPVASTNPNTSNTTRGTF